MDIYKELYAEMALRAEEVAKDINSYVAMYNIKDRKAFFFMTNEEARLAINYISDIRKNGDMTWGAKEHELATAIIKSIDIDGELNYKPVRMSKYSNSNFSTNYLNACFSEIEEKDNAVTSIFMNAKTFGYIRALGKGTYDDAKRGDIRKNGIRGWIYTAGIRIANNLQDNTMLFCYLAGNTSEENDIVVSHFRDNHDLY